MSTVLKKKKSFIAIDFTELFEKQSKELMFSNNKLSPLSTSHASSE
jgi:hypothetical protein